MDEVPDLHPQPPPDTGETPALLRPSVRSVALGLLKRGVSVVPCYDWDAPEIEGQGPKKPTISWLRLKSQLLTLEEGSRAFVDGLSVAIVFGRISGNAECLDFERLSEYEAWRELLVENGVDGALAGVVLERSPRGGVHVLYRCADAISGNRKLAVIKRPPELPAEEEWHAGIETRGEGGYALVWPSKGYELLQGRLDQMPVLTAEERETFLAAAAYFDERDKPEISTTPTAAQMPAQGPSASIKDDFNARGDHRELLSAVGWVEIGRKSGGRDLWRRPGKAKGYSATWSGTHLKVHTGASEIAPLEMGGWYDKFGLYARLVCSGDFRAAAKVLAGLGYGSRRSAERVPPPADSDASLGGGSKPAKVAAPAARTAFPRVVLASSVEPRQVDWLMYPYFIRGQYQDVSADPGTGKTFFLEAIGSAISTGKPYGLPWCPERIDAGNVLLFATEDSLESVTIPRLISLGANLDRIKIVDEAFPFNRAGLAYFESLLKEWQPVWVMVDPFTRFLEMALKVPKPDVDAHYVVAQLRRLAELYRSAIVSVRHKRKSGIGDSNAVHAAYGGIEIVGAARSALMLAKDDGYAGPGIKKVNVAHYKTNFGKEGEPFSFQLRSVSRDVVEFSWMVDRPKGATPAEMMMSPALRAEASQCNDVKDLILRQLAGYKPVRIKELEALLDSKGYSTSMIRRAKEELHKDGKVTSRQATKAEGGRGFLMQLDHSVILPFAEDEEEEYDPYADS